MALAQGFRQMTPDKNTNEISVANGWLIIGNYSISLNTISSFYRCGDLVMIRHPYAPKNQPFSGVPCLYELLVYALIEGKTDMSFFNQQHKLGFYKEP
jgi:hypothetical protein